MNFILRKLVGLFVVAIAFSHAPQTRADGVPFRLKFTGGGDSPTIEITNQSNLEIGEFRLTIGDTSKNFDAVTGKSPAANINLVTPDSSQQDVRTDEIKLLFSGFTEGKKYSIRAEFDPDNEQNPGMNYRTILFNNGDSPNAVATVVAKNGRTEQLVLEDTGNADGGTYIFESESRPRALSVTSVTEANSDIFVEKVDLTINDLAPASARGEAIGNTRNFTVVDGDVVRITAPAVVYKDMSGGDVQDSLANDAQFILSNAEERYQAKGISVNNVPQTGDPTVFQFVVDGDADLIVKWTHDYALRIQHDFGLTKSNDTDSNGNPWAGPLVSAASGNPEPLARKHWIPRGENLTPQIEGQVVDFSRPGLDIRYVPTGFLAYGPPNVSTTRKDDEVRFAGMNLSTNPGSLAQTAFSVGQAPPQRQQVGGEQGFSMYGPGGIKYVWQIQFGARINIDDLSRTTLPRIFDTSDPTDPTLLFEGEGVFWYNPGDSLFVASPANLPNDSTTALKGWFNGDGYFFDGEGEVNTDNGALNFGQGAGPTQWISQFQNGGRLYRGLWIPNAQRSLRTQWTYGGQVILEEVDIGEHVFQGRPELAADFTVEPELIEKVSGPGGANDPDMAVWDPVAKKLYPLVPNSVFDATWARNGEDGRTVTVRVTVNAPSVAHYPHVAGAPPVALDPDDDDDFFFKELKYSDNSALADTDNLFTADTPGVSVLLFSEISRDGRGVPQEFLRVRLVETKSLNTVIASRVDQPIIGQKISDSLDAAEIGTGWIVDPEGDARYNPFIYDPTKLEGIAANEIYDLEKLRSISPTLDVVDNEALPGPIIPVNQDPGERLTVVWYDDPRENDGLLWPSLGRNYEPKWPTNAAEGLGRIVIASQFGSESQVINGGSELVDQEIVPAIGDFPADTTYNPTRLQQLQVYNQPDPDSPGYNLNEEHALIAPSLRFANVSPRPSAVYALRDNDLNRYSSSGAQPSNYTSHPFVLTQFFDVADSEFKMRVYEVAKEDAAAGYEFATQRTVTPATEGGTVSADGRTLLAESHLEVEAGEPVIPFYPLPEVIGAAPCVETFGTNIKGQDTYWEDVKETSWVISGGENAWFTGNFFYPILPDFWWPDDQKGAFDFEASIGFFRLTVTRSAKVPDVGDCVPFLPADLSAFDSLSAPTSFFSDLPTDLQVNLNRLKEAGISRRRNRPFQGLSAATRDKIAPVRILYRGVWPEVAPVLKAGETLTFSGGEYRADNPNSTVIGVNGDLETVETPGLPGVVAFASAEVVFDSLNPRKEADEWKTSWTARVIQALEQRSVEFPIGDFPAALLPATGKTRVSQGKYIFTDLPASLQKRIRYNPLSTFVDDNGLTVNGKLELIGILNDKDIGASTLTAAPPAVYTLEPNVLTIADLLQLRKISSNSNWRSAILELYRQSRNPQRLTSSGSVINNRYLAGLQPQTDDTDIAEPLQALGPGLALVPNGGFLNPNGNLPEVSYVCVAENNDPNLDGSPITIHVIKVDRRERYRGAIKTILSDNVFDENTTLRHTGDFGGAADALTFEWWYRPDDGSLNVPPPDLIPNGQTNPWKLFADTSGNQGIGRYEVMLKGNPNAPEALLADTFWFVRYRHNNDPVDSGSTDWGVTRPVGTGPVNYTWAGAGNSDPFNDFDLNGLPDFQAQLAQGWIKRVLDAVNPYEARIREFDGDNPSTKTSMIAQFGQRFEGPVALNPDKDVIENVGLIELYETVLKRGRDLSIDLSTPISTPAIANALQLASTRIADFYTILGNEAYVDALNHTIGIGSDVVEAGSLSPATFAFQNRLPDLLAEELGLMRGLDDFFARPVYNRLFPNFTKGEGEAAYATNYNISDINQDGFIDEADAFILYPQGHGDAYGHYLTALRAQYDLFNHPFFNWVSRSEFYNLQDIVIKVDFLDERKFAQTAAAQAKTAASIVDLTYREKYVEDPSAQWQGYTDANKDRAWGVQGWARRAGQQTYFNWVTSNALLPAEHPNETLEGIQKVDRTTNGDIAVLSANLNAIQDTFDEANNGQNPLGVSTDSVIFDLDPTFLEVGSTAQIGTRAVQGLLHFDQIWERALEMVKNAKAIWDNANQNRNRLRAIANSEREFRNDVFQEDLEYRNRMIEIFGAPYEGTIGSGKLYPPGYDGPDTQLFMYVDTREITNENVPRPTTQFAEFEEASIGGQTLEVLKKGDLKKAFDAYGNEVENVGRRPSLKAEPDRSIFASTFFLDKVENSDKKFSAVDVAGAGLYDVEYTELVSPKIPLEGLQAAMPITAAGYTFQAPETWGSRSVTGELQLLINQMIQQEAEIAVALGAWDGLQGSIVRTLRLLDARVELSKDVHLALSGQLAGTALFGATVIGLNTASEVLDVAGELLKEATEAGVDGVPKELPTAGLAFSPGDALFAVRLSLKAAGTGFFGSTLGAKITLDTLASTLELTNDLLQQGLDQKIDGLDRDFELKEALVDLENLVGDEPILRIQVFKEIQALRELSDKYRSLVAEGSRLIDERMAFNKRVAAQTQRNRYQDATFRVSKNHMLANYRKAHDLAAQMTYLAAKAYDYETNYDPSDPGSPRSMFNTIVKARGLGLIEDGVPRLSNGGLGGALATMMTNFETQRGQLGLNNPQSETGKMSLRTELFRILPAGATQPANPQFPAPGSDSDALWRQTLTEARVDDLWLQPEFRYYCRPFAPEADASGNHIEQPGLVFRFGTEVSAGKNFFGKPLSGADHAYDPSVYAHRIRALGLWFSDYQSEDVLGDLSETPRVYLVPAGSDIMSVPTHSNPNMVRIWNVLDQRIPIPLPATTADLDRANFSPLLDTLSGRLGEPRKFASFRAYHDGGSAVNDEELVFNTRLISRSIWNTQWVLIVPGAALNADPNVGLDRFINQVSDIKLVLWTYGTPGG